MSCSPQSLQTEQGFQSGTQLSLSLIHSFKLGKQKLALRSYISILKQTLQQARIYERKGHQRRFKSDLAYQSQSLVRSHHLKPSTEETQGDLGYSRAAQHVLFENLLSLCQEHPLEFPRLQGKVLGHGEKKKKSHSFHARFARDSSIAQTLQVPTLSSTYRQRPGFRFKISSHALLCHRHLQLHRTARCCTALWDY